MHYCLLYLRIYQKKCTFEIEVTDRYPSKADTDDENDDDEDHDNNDNENDNNNNQSNKSNDQHATKPHLEGCVVARQHIKKGAHIEFLDGWLAGLEDDVENTFQGETDFSIIHTSRNGNANLLLGPARFVNHDCSPNCSFSRKGKRISLRAIKNISPGQEVTVTYAKNYFGYRNRECRCVTCEVRGVNGFGTPNDYNSDEDSSDTDALTKLKRQKRQQNKLNSLVGLNADQDATSSLVSSPAVESIDSESTLHSSRSPSVTADADTPASSLEPFPDKTGGQEVPLKRRLRQREEDINVEDKLFKFTFDDDDANFTTTREEWKLLCRGMNKEDRENYTLHDYIFSKLSDRGRYKDLQRFFFSCAIEADLDLTLDCVNCSTPFFGPDDRIAPRRLPTRLCPRCHRHAVIFNAYWPSVEPEVETITLYRAWDFTSLKDIGVRGEFVPPDEKKKRKDLDDLTVSSEDDDSDDESSDDEMSENDVTVTLEKKRPGRPRKIPNPTRRVGRPRKHEPLELETKFKQKSTTTTTITKPTVPPGRPGRVLNNGRANGRHLGRRKRLDPEDLDTSGNENEHESDSDEVIIMKTIRSKRTYKRRKPEISQAVPRRQPRLTFDVDDNSRSRRASPDETTARRPLYVVPLNSDKPMCILNPPTGTSGSIFLTTASGEKITIAAPGSEFIPTEMSPLRESISINDLSQRSVVPDVAAVAVGGAGISYLANGKTRERTRAFRYPKIKTIGLTSKRTDDYSSPSWKLLQQVQSSRY
ncbi:hypothetical protein D0Z00_002257 [Geotrichum galactomycetum]|uniref:Uncharacterized protein n=1 Tax=Geotrichum galactomycetum TaxID=27317 RepID=A0ACB6V4L8_9ASCO|nr:hypothetical protein D0Z00_002257 [Geotrichum candidum]